MWEILYIAASSRLPIVMPVVNRALSGPINIHNDHSDTMGARDSGWIQLYSENAQEAYDNVIQAFRIGEHRDVSLPVMPTLDGFILSHTMETLDVFEDDAVVKEFTGEYEPEHFLLDTDNPFTMGPLDLQNFYFEHKRQQVEGMTNAYRVVREIADEFAELSGRSYGYIEPYKLDDAECALVVLGSTCGTVKVAVDTLREKGVRAGLLKIRMFRPFPADEIIDALSGIAKVGVMDKACSFGIDGGPVFHEIRSCAYGKLDIPLKSYIYGLGGRDITVQHIMDIFEGLRSWDGDGDIVEFYGVRE
jgi:pyruvate ferredoxin oxidoreductase alpha subunit